MLEARGLMKSYDGMVAVRDISFTIRPGEVLGYLGPNGSGKSTTVKMLTGLATPTRGEVLFEGEPISRCLVEYRRRLGYVPEEAHLYPFLTGQEYLQLVGRLRGIPERPLTTKVDALLELLALRGSAWAPISTYSKGMRQKVLLAAAILHDPEVIILDEPLSGLDVAMAMVCKHLISRWAMQGKMILYCSHVLEVVEKVCSTVAILHKGQVVAHDSVEHLRKLLVLPSLEAVFAELVEQADTEQTANDIIAVIRS
jgi:ABC-2 type transport system ATP-binding protein